MESAVLDFFGVAGEESGVHVEAGRNTISRRGGDWRRGERERTEKVQSNCGVILRFESHWSITLDYNKFFWASKLIQLRGQLVKRGPQSNDRPRDNFLMCRRYYIPKVVKNIKITGLANHIYVITVSTYFNNSQCKTTKDVGALARLNVIRMINVSTIATVACEKAKKNLSSIEYAEIVIGSFHDETEFTLHISWETFEMLNDNLVKMYITTMEECLKGAKIDKSAIDEVILVGGLTRIPKIESVLEDYFDGKKCIT
ncbi:unnamed protein product [Lactuca virosa]|uniref:Uncharacterized protein n=1 Tax=Lactuca virosa TaxID=75947 RepID=A0AAU9MMV0_9ASTR|nr:unnamed protein product [Lactuca virosa]